MWTPGIAYDEDYCRQVDEYWRKVAESGFFDIEGIKAPRGVTGLVPYNCQGLDQLGGFPYRPLILLYARVGLQLYNMENGTNFELHCLIKFNVVSAPASSFYVTLAARDTVTRRPMQTFQERETINSPLPPLPSHADYSPFTDIEWVHTSQTLPDWPSHDDAFNDTQRFYLVEGSELLSAYWIRMYLQLAVYATHRSTPLRSLCNLKIVKAAIETSNEDVNERLKAKNAIFYIAFKGLALDGIGEHVERKVIIRRSFHEPTGKLSLKGELCKGEGEEELTVEYLIELHKQGVESRRRRLADCL